MATLIPRTGILNIKPHMLAAPLHNETQALVNLSSNESALGPSPRATAAAQQAAHAGDAWVFGLRKVHAGGL